MSTSIKPDKLRIVHYPDPVLRRVCTTVERFDDSLRQVLERMFTLMRTGKGVGLAAPQVGLDLRLFVCNHTGEPGDNLACINPEILDLDGAVEMEEGCLSLPNVSVAVRRGQKARIRAYDIEGRQFEREATDLLARIWQHESDHLDGRLILDYMSEASRIANRRAIKQLEDDYAASSKKRLRV